MSSRVQTAVKETGTQGHDAADDDIGGAAGQDGAAGSGDGSAVRGGPPDAGPTPGSDQQDPGHRGRVGRAERSGSLRGVSRRTLLIAGGATAGLGAAGALYASLDEPAAPRHEQRRAHGRRRRPGDVDQPGAQWVPASEANWRWADRPYDYAIDRVVIHVVEGSYAVALKVFQDPKHRAAAHYVVREDGHIAQAIREMDVAYHAGNRDYNERSVGIEHAGWVNGPNSFTEPMYRASAELTAGVCQRYGIPLDRQHIMGHVEVPGTDHKDPGPYWDWDHYMRLLRAAGRS